jgi:23S rRNA (cytosine1962-C5)-methyltransferase
MSIAVARTAQQAILRGHPWVYRAGLVRAPTDLASGAVVELVDEQGSFLARGLWDARSPIAVRVFEREASRRVDLSSLIDRIEHALRLRDEFFARDADTNAYRLVHGEGDRVPGLVIDRYGPVAVVRVDGDAIEAWLDRLTPPLAAMLARRGLRSVLLRVDAAPGQPRARALHGAPPPERIVIQERGMAMEVDLFHGQKTGAFLDQRDNRARVRTMALGRKRVLNLFSYAGGFSIAAALGGAERVTSVDLASAAHATAQRSFRENGIDPGNHAFVTADAMAFLDAARARGDRFDLIVSDPPSFAPNERSVERAITAYRKLHGAVVQVLAERGIFCASSCSSHISTEAFLGTLDDRALGAGAHKLRLCELYGQPEDHPTLPAWPEGRYLKFAVLR